MDSITVCGRGPVVIVTLQFPFKSICQLYEAFGNNVIGPKKNQVLVDNFNTLCVEIPITLNSTHTQKEIDIIIIM